MKTVVILTIFFLFICYVGRPKRYRREIYNEIFFIFSLLLVVISLLVSTMKFFVLDDIKIVLIISFVLYMFYKLRTIGKTLLKIFAKRMSFWDVSESQLKEAFGNRVKTINKGKKTERTEIVDIKEDYFFEIINNEKVLNPLIYSDTKAYREFTIIKNINYFDKQNKNLNPLHKIIFNKLKDINEDFEKNIDFEKKIEENNHILEFYLLDLWENLAKKEILGVGTLNAIAKTQKDLDLIGAMDNAISSMAGSLGLSLFLHYSEFKGRISSISENKTFDTFNELSTPEHITTYEEEVKESLVNIVTAYNSKKKDYREFILSLSSIKKADTHGEYTPSTKTIVIYDSINKHKQHLIASAIHELAHHIECCDSPDNKSGHSRNFFSIMKDLFIVAIGLDEINYKIAYEKNAIDSSDIEDMEKLFPDMAEYRE